MANSVDPDQTALIAAVCSGSTLFASVLNSSVMLDNYLQQTTSADDIFICVFLGALWVKKTVYWLLKTSIDQALNLFDSASKIIVLLETT